MCTKRISKVLSGIYGVHQCACLMLCVKYIMKILNLTLEKSYKFIANKYRYIYMLYYQYLELCKGMA